MEMRTQCPEYLNSLCSVFCRVNVKTRLLEQLPDLKSVFEVSEEQLLARWRERRMAGAVVRRGSIGAR